MKPKDQVEFNALETSEDRAKWLLLRGVKGKLVMKKGSLDITFQAVSANAILPAGDFSSAAEAIAGGTAWLSKMAGFSLENT